MTRCFVEGSPLVVSPAPCVELGPVFTGCPDPPRSDPDRTLVPSIEPSHKVCRRVCFATRALPIWVCASVAGLERWEDDFELRSAGQSPVGCPVSDLVVLEKLQLCSLRWAPGAPRS